MEFLIVLGMFDSVSEAVLICQEILLWIIGSTMSPTSQLLGACARTAPRVYAYVNQENIVITKI